MDMVDNSDGSPGAEFDRHGARRVAMHWLNVLQHDKMIVPPCSSACTAS